jgi:transcriptional regulator with XRE-family HTH domain
MYDIFERLLKEYGITPYRVSKETGVPQSTLSDWKNGKGVPKVDKLKAIADYFHVSVDYLLGNEQKEKPVVPDNDGLDPLDKRIIELLHSLTPENQEIALAQLDAMLKIQGKK